MIIRQMTREDLSTALDWAALEGWNPGLEDADAFFRADSEGFFAAEIDGALAASMSVVNHSDTFSFAGLYICRPEFRGRGIGLALWTQALDHAGDRTIGLDGVPAQQDNYRKSGFEWAGETLRFAGDVASAANPAVRRAEADDIPALLALDGGPRDIRGNRSCGPGWRTRRRAAPWSSKRTAVRRASPPTGNVARG